MGNCLRRDSAMVWAGDDGDDDTCQLQQPHDDDHHHNNRINACNPEKQRLLGDRQIRVADSSSNHSFCSSSSRVGPTATTAGDRQVKIKISKKELEELVGSRGNICMEALSSSSVEQLLARLIIISTNNNIHHPAHHIHDHYDQRSWRPALQSIPELS